jgi:response regulator RpfG family c-di-GMP phosphodiesterase
MFSLKEFASGVLKQISAILDVGTDGILCVESTPDMTGRPQLEILAAAGAYETLLESGSLDDYPLAQAIRRLLEKRIYQHPCQRNLPSTSRRPGRWMMSSAICWKSSATQLRHSQQEATVVALAALAEYRDTDTGAHVQRVQKLTHAIAGEIRRGGHYLEQLTPEFMDMVGMASILHDVGKVGTPDHILFKPGKLDPDERRIMEQHASIGASILAKSAQMVEGQSYLSLGSEIAGGHHEHFDGNGYPQKLSGQAIPLSARIVAVVDVFDALLNKRPYKEPWELSETLDYIRSRAGSQFDPVVVNALMYAG